MKPMQTHLATAVSLLLLIAASTAQAASVEEAANALKWETQSIQVQAEAGQERVSVAYPFVNASDRPVRILDTKASCGCTVPEPDKRIVEPGESSEIQAIFNVGSRKGKQVMRIQIYTDEPGPTPWHELTLEVDIPELIDIEPRVRMWRHNGDPETQTYRIVIHENRPMEIQSAAPREASEAAPFAIEIETVAPSREYLVKLTPTDTSTQTRQVILLSSEDDPSGLLQRYPLYAFIR